MELQADAEHQQDDADFCQLLGNAARRRRCPACSVRPACRRQVADDGGEADALRDVAEQQGPGERRQVSVLMISSLTD